MRKFFVLWLCVLGLLLASCDDPMAPIATPTQISATSTRTSATLTQTPIKTWHVAQHFSSTIVLLFGISSYQPNRSVSITVTPPWRAVWQAHVDTSDQSPQSGFTLTFCYIPAKSAWGLTDCTVLVENSYDHSGVTAPITAIGNYPELDTSILTVRLNFG